MEEWLKNKMNHKVLRENVPSYPRRFLQINWLTHRRIRQTDHQWRVTPPRVPPPHPPCLVEDEWFYLGLADFLLPDYLRSFVHVFSQIYPCSSVWLKTVRSLQRRKFCLLRKKRNKMSFADWTGTREHPMIYRGPGFLAVVWFSSSPIPFPPYPISSLYLFISLPVLSPVELTGRRGGGGGGGGRGAKSFDRKKALLSINHSILSGGNK
jgi:hypothetical protein